jgi:chromate transporter
MSATFAGGADWWALFAHFLMLSLLAIGGALGTAPEMHRVVVGERGWITDAQFTDSVALAQAAPGPNLLFVVVVGFNVAGLAGAAVALVGMLIPSTALALGASRYAARNRTSRGVRAFVSGMAPITLGLLLATGWILLEPVRTQPGPVLLAVAAALLAWRTKISPVWLVAAGAAAGALGVA